jgi:hypothetical protein
MNNQESIGNFVVNGNEINDTNFDIFNLPETDNSIFSGKEVEIRLFTVLERYVANN